MATTKPRINVTLEQHRFELFKRLAALQGVSMSSLVAELLETVAEPMERVCVVLEAAAKAPGDLKTGLRAAVDRAEAGLLPNARAVMGQFDMFLGECGDAIASSGDAGRERSAEASDAPSARPASDRAAAKDPRPVTRGSTPLRKRGKAAPEKTTQASSRAPSKRKAS